MKAKTFLILPALFIYGSAEGQSNAPAAPPPAPKPHVADVPQPAQPSAATPATASGDNLDPAKVAEFQKRFGDGYALEQDGKLTEARTIFDGILAEEPKAKRSLLEAGKISFKLGELAKADDYLSRLHEQVPDFPEAIELLIQINQALKHDVKVELLIREFGQLRDSGKVPDLSRSICFVRERIHVDQQDIIISQFFNYTEDPNTVWMAEVYDTNGLLTRRLLLNYDAAATLALRAKDSTFAPGQVFTWYEHKLKGGQVSEIDAYLQILALPDYQKFRSAMFVILANPPKPIYSAPVTAQQSQ
jgi:tetratricopeptide (TPR) repeat protein